MTQPNSRYRQSGAVAIRLQHRCPVTVQVLASTASQQLLAENEQRAGFSIDNRSGAYLRLSYSDTADESTAFMTMAPRSFVHFDQDLIVGNAITGSWTEANGHAQVTEYS